MILTGLADLSGAGQDVRVTRSRRGRPNGARACAWRSLTQHSGEVPSVSPTTRIPRSSTVVPMTTMLTWQAEGGHGLEGARLLFQPHGFRALGRLVKPEPDGDFTASYRLIVGAGGALVRLSVTAATAERERHLTINRTDDGVWLLDTGTGGGTTRTDFAGIVDVDLEFSAMFNTLPIRRLGLHRQAGEHVIPMVFVSLPDLDVAVVRQTYRTVSVLDENTGRAVVEFRSDDVAAELVVDADGVVLSYPGIATRLVSGAAPPAG
jgi:uncharacterized protein